MLLVKAINLSQKSSFSSLLLPLCGAYADIMFTNLAPIINLIAIICSFTLLTSTMLSIHFLATNIPTPACEYSFYYIYIYYIYIHVYICILYMYIQYTHTHTHLYI